MRRKTSRWLGAGTASAMLLTLGGITAPAMATHEDYTEASGIPGDDLIVVPINDSAAGGTYYQPFVLEYDETTDAGTPVYIYVPKGAIDEEGGPVVDDVHSLDPTWDHNPDDEFDPCPENTAEEFEITQDQVDYLGEQLSNQIVAVDEQHFGPIGEAVQGDPATDALVTLVYNVQDESYYDCSVTSYTAGYFAPDFIDSLGMNIIVLDAFDWANRIGEDPDALWGHAGPDRPELYEGVIAHELEHLLMNDSDAGELSWVDEGLADMAAFLNGFDMTGSHLTYQQVFHRETSLTRWGGGLENYGASFSYFLYLWEQAGGNGGNDEGSLEPDLLYDDTAGDLLIKLIFAEQADGMVGVQNAIDTFNKTYGNDLRSAEELFKDWVVTMYLDDEDSSLWDLENFDLGPASGGWTIDVANDVFWDDRGNYVGAVPDARRDRLKNRPDTTALPFGVSYEKFRNPGVRIQVDFEGEATTRVAPLEGETHWWGGYASQSDHILGLDTAVSEGDIVTFTNWHFIEEGWDYGFVEALVGEEWVTVEVKNADTGEVVSTDEDPHGNNTEGNGITGTSGGEYFVDEPQYLTYEVTVPQGASDLRFRYSTDAAYLDTGWFIDQVWVDGADADASPEDEGWIETTGAQDNNWAVQVIASCDLTPAETIEGELTDDAGNFVYRFESGSDEMISTPALDTKCANGKQSDFVLAISNLPSGDLAVLDADYEYSVSNAPGRPNGRGRG